MEDADARSRILACATRLFGRKGFGATATREVVEAAGVTKPVLYYWFGSKERLFLAAVQAQVDKLQALVHGALQGSGSLQERLVRLVDRYVASALADQDGCRLMLTAQHPTDDRQPEVDLLSVHQETVRVLADLLERARRDGELREDADPALGALSLLGAAHLVIAAGLHGAPLPRDVGATLVRGFLFGVVPR